MSQNIKPTFIFIATLGILSMLPPLGVDMYIPSFLNIAEDLNIDSEQVQHTLTFFAYGMAAGQLFWGPFGDSFGRKPIILLGVIIGAITAIVLTGIHSIGSFTALRFVQGFFGAAPVVLSGALLRDLFSKDQLSRIMSTITLVFMIAPLVAPIIGGYIVKYFHWHMIFYVIGIMGFLAALLVFFIIPETHKQENRIPLRLNIIARNFMMLSKQKEVLGYMAAASFGFGGLFAFVTAGSIVYIGIYGIPVDQFGYFFMINIAIMTAASYLNGKFVLKLGAETMLRIGIAVQFISGIWLFLTALFDFGFWSMAIGVAFFVEKFPTMAGTANSLMGSVRFGVGAVMGSLVASFKMETAAPMLYTMTACVVISALSYYFLTYRNER